MIQMKSSLNAISELPSFPLVSHQSCIIGNVTIHPSAVIAPGVVIQATSDSQVIIEEGACIGMGVVIKAYQGNIVIEKGAILGARVLIIGKGRIGNHTCIGAATTIFNSSVEPMLVINAYSVLGDSSRFFELEIVENPLIDQSVEQTIFEQVNPNLELEFNGQISDPWDDESKPQFNREFVEELKAQIEPEKLSEAEEIITEKIKEQFEENKEEVLEVLTEVDPLEVTEVKTEVKEISKSSPEDLSQNLSQDLAKNLGTEITEITPKAPVVGKVYINNLLLTLFPNRQSTL